MYSSYIDLYLMPQINPFIFDNEGYYNVKESILYFSFIIRIQILNGCFGYSTNVFWNGALNLIRLFVYHALKICIFFQMADHLLECMAWRPLSCSSWLRLFRVYNYNGTIVAAFMRNPNTYFKCYTISWWHTNVLPDLQDIIGNRLFWNILRTILIG